MKIARLPSDLYLQVQLYAALNPMNKLLFEKLVRLNLLLRTTGSSILLYIHVIQEINEK